MKALDLYIAFKVPPRIPGRMEVERFFPLSSGIGSPDTVSRCPMPTPPPLFLVALVPWDVVALLELENK